MLQMMNTEDYFRATDLSHIIQTSNNRAVVEVKVLEKVECLGLKKMVESFEVDAVTGSSLLDGMRPTSSKIEFTSSKWFNSKETNLVLWIFTPE